MQKDKEKPTEKLNNYMKYSAIGFQIGGSLAGGALIGYFIDKQMGNKQFHRSLSSLHKLVWGFC